MVRIVCFLQSAVCIGCIAGLIGLAGLASKTPGHFSLAYAYGVVFLFFVFFLLFYIRVGSWFFFSRSNKPEPSGLSQNKIPPIFRSTAIAVGYRKPGCSIMDCVKSLVQLNNELVNVWTHLIMALTFIPLSFAFQSIAVRFYSAGITVCGTLSAAAHCFNVKSFHARYYAFIADYAGISILFFSIGVALRSCCDSFDSSLYLPTLTLLSVLGYLGSCGSLFARSIFFQKHGRALSFSAVYAVSCFPVLYRAGYYLVAGNLLGFSKGALGLHGLAHAVFVLSAFYYASYFPQKYALKIFDIFGHSHQFFHTLTFFASIIQLQAILQDINDRQDVNELSRHKLIALIVVNCVIYLGSLIILRMAIKKDVNLRKLCNGQYKID